MNPLSPKTVPGNPKRPLTKPMLREYRALNAEFPRKEMLEVDLPPDRETSSRQTPVSAWRSRDFLAVLYRETNGNERLSVNRTALPADCSDWKDGISWDDLMWVKSACGLGDRWAVECYPPDDEVINVANIRHLWILEEQPVTSWTKNRLSEEVKCG